MCPKSSIIRFVLLLPYSVEIWMGVTDSVLNYKSNLGRERAGLERNRLTSYLKVLTSLDSCSVPETNSTIEVRIGVDLDSGLKMDSHIGIACLEIVIFSKCFLFLHP